MSRLITSAEKLGSAFVYRSGKPRLWPSSCDNVSSIVRPPPRVAAQSSGIPSTAMGTVVPPGIVNEPPHACAQKNLSVAAVPCDLITRMSDWTPLKSISALPELSVSAAPADTHACANACPSIGANEFAGHGAGMPSKLSVHAELSVTLGGGFSTSDNEND